MWRAGIWLIILGCGLLFTNFVVIPLMDYLIQFSKNHDWFFEIVFVIIILGALLIAIDFIKEKIKGREK